MRCALTARLLRGVPYCRGSAGIAWNQNRPQNKNSKNKVSYQRVPTICSVNTSAATGCDCNTDNRATTTMDGALTPLPHTFRQHKLLLYAINAEYQIQATPATTHSTKATVHSTCCIKLRHETRRGNKCGPRYAPCKRRTNREPAHGSRYVWNDKQEGAGAGGAIFFRPCNNTKTNPRTHVTNKTQSTHGLCRPTKARRLWLSKAIFKRRSSMEYTATQSTPVAVMRTPR